MPAPTPYIPESVCIAMILNHTYANQTNPLLPTEIPTEMDECSALSLAFESAHCPFALHHAEDPDTNPFLVNCCKELKKRWNCHCDDDRNGALSDQRLTVTILAVITCLFVKQVRRNNRPNHTVDLNPRPRTLSSSE